MASLTIRNTTTTPLELKLVERYVPPQSSPSSSSPPPPLATAAAVAKGVKSRVTGFLRQHDASRAEPTPAAVAQSAQTFTAQEAAIRIEPLCACETDIAPADAARRETLRLTFEAVGSGERYRVDTPAPSNASTELVALTPAPRFAFTGVYLPRHAHLSLLSSAQLERWMGALRDDVPLGALSMPGTHNSPTHHAALPSVRCQAVSVAQQLAHGVRFLDVRVQPAGDPDDANSDALVLVHGVFPIALTGSKHFRELVADVRAFLARCPTETVVVSVKREGPGSHTDAQLSRRLKRHYVDALSDGGGPAWYTEPRVPALGEVRGRMVLLRRFALDNGLRGEWGGRGWGIDAETWAYNTPHDTCPSGDVCVQDFCEVLEEENIDAKIRYCVEALDRSGGRVCALGGAGPGAADGGKLPLYINFLSASNFWRVGCWPEKIAVKLNPAIVEYLCRSHNLAADAVPAPPSAVGPSAKSLRFSREGDGSTGIVVCDWVGNNGDWDIVRCIVGMNAELELKGRQA